MALWSFPVYCGLNFFLLMDCSVLCLQNAKPDQLMLLLCSALTSAIYLALALEFSATWKFRLAAFISGLAATALFLKTEKTEPAWCSLAVAGIFLYSGKGPSIRKIPLAKNIMVAVSWSLSVVFFMDRPAMNGILTAVTALNFILILTLSLLSDKVDHNKDMGDEHVTAYSLFPRSSYYFLISILLLSYGCLAIIEGITMVRFILLMAVMMPPVATMLSGKRDGKLMKLTHSKFFLDSSIVFHCLFLLLLNRPL